MNCRIVRKKWLSCLDGELAADEQRSIGEHLRTCPSCRIRCEKVESYWTSPESGITFPAPPGLWRKIRRRIGEPGISRNPIRLITSRPTRFAVGIAGTILVMAGIGAGIFLGSFAETPKMEFGLLDSDPISGKEFTESDIFHSFDTLPSESLGGVYLTMGFKIEGNSDR